MAEERVQRRLAAILAADVVGYSRLMEADESGTLARLKALRRELFEPKTKQHGGRIFKTTGDGALVEFKSAVDAVNSAVEIQSALAERDEGLAEDHRICLRIGISLGDVIVEGSDLYGNGVNVAARMEALAAPGGICFSGNVHEHVRGAAGLVFDDLGEQQVKNIDRPVHAYRIVVSGQEPASSPVPEIDAVLHRPAVAVLPFENLSGDPDQEYFADGLTEDLITALSLWRSFPVIARNSTFAYKGTSPDIRQVGKGLGARYVIEGSVRKAGHRVRVTVQLINAATGHHIWAERYDRDLDDIFALQDEITERIATTVAPELERAERQGYGSKQPSDLQAWDCYLRGMSYLHEFSREGNRQALEMFERAVALDPTYGRGHAGIAYCHYRDALLGFSDDQERSIAQCVEAAKQSVSFDDTDAFTHFVLSRGLHLAGRIAQGLHEAKQAIALNPYDAHCYGSLGSLLMAAGQLDEGIAAVHRARQLSPQDPRAYLFSGLESGGHFVAGRFDEAAMLAKDALNRRPGDPAVQVLLAASLGNAGRADEARSVLAEGGPIDLAILESTWFMHWFKEADRKRLVDGLHKAGWEG